MPSLHTRTHTDCPFKRNDGVAFLRLRDSTGGESTVLDRKKKEKGEKNLLTPSRRASTSLSLTPSLDWVTHTCERRLLLSNHPTTHSRLSFKTIASLSLRLSGTKKSIDRPFSLAFASLSLSFSRSLREERDSRSRPSLSSHGDCARSTTGTVFAHATFPLSLSLSSYGALKLQVGYGARARPLEA